MSANSQPSKDTMERHPNQLQTLLKHVQVHHPRTYTRALELAANEIATL